eukprot:3880955-Amphidinium_carterae.2
MLWRPTWRGGWFLWGNVRATGDPEYFSMDGAGERFVLTWTTLVKGSETLCSQQHKPWATRLAHTHTHTHMHTVGSNINGSFLLVILVYRANCNEVNAARRTTFQASERLGIGARWVPEYTGGGHVGTNVVSATSFTYRLRNALHGSLGLRSSLVRASACWCVVGTHL